MCRNYLRVNKYIKNNNNDLILFTHYYVTPKPYFLSFVEHKIRYFDKCVFIRFSSFIMLRNLLLCVPQKKEGHTGVEQIEGEYIPAFSFFL